MKLSVSAAELTLDPRLGNLRNLRFSAGGDNLFPLHSAPWLNDPAVQADPDLPMVEKRLSGDFFCAPFGASEDAPIHGWTANSVWEVEEIVQSGRAAVARLSLTRPVKGARIEKELRLRKGEPFLYQSHRIAGGYGGLSVAHHPMVRMADGGRLCFSKKRVALTADKPLEPGRNWLAYPAQSTDLSQFPGADGPVDLHHYPQEKGHEDFITLIEAPENTLGWTAVLRKAEKDIVFFLKDPTVLPVTMLWYSNGGRDPAPWSGQHVGVLGIEDGCAAGAEGQAAAEGENSVSKHGVPTVLPLALDRVHVVRQAIGAVPCPNGWTAVENIRLDQGTLTLFSDTGEALHLPFDGRFFKL